MDGREITLNDTSFVVGTTIGSGRFGKVKTAKRISDGTVVALKITDPLEARKNFRREVGALKTLSGLPSIVEYVDHGEGVLYPKTRGRTPIYRDVLAIKLAKHGELYPFLLINEEPCPLPEPVARALFLELVTGLESMHRSRVAHRDIKLQNILLDEGYHLILTDFGLASPPQSPEREASFQGSSGGWKMESGEEEAGSGSSPSSPSASHGPNGKGASEATSGNPIAPGSFSPGNNSIEAKDEERPASLQLHSIVGTRGHQAPEVLHHKPYDGFKADVWSAGVVLFNLVTAAPPYENSRDWWYRALTTSRDKFWNQHRKFMPTPISPECQDLLDRMLTIEPEARISVNDIKTHPWMTKPAASREVITTELERRNEALRSGPPPTKEEDDGLDVLDVFAEDVARELPPTIVVKVLETIENEPDDEYLGEELVGEPKSSSSNVVYVASEPPTLPSGLSPTMFTRSTITALKPVALAQAIMNKFEQFGLKLVDDCESFHFRGCTTSGDRMNVRVFSMENAADPYIVAHLGGVPSSSSEFRLHIKAWRELLAALR